MLKLYLVLNLDFRVLMGKYEVVYMMIIHIYTYTQREANL